MQRAPAPLASNPRKMSRSPVFQIFQRFNMRFHNGSQWFTVVQQSLSIFDIKEKQLWKLEKLDPLGRGALAMSSLQLSFMCASGSQVDSSKSQVCFKCQDSTYETSPLEASSEKPCHFTRKCLATGNSKLTAVTLAFEICIHKEYMKRLKIDATQIPKWLRFTIVPKNFWILPECKREIQSMPQLHLVCPPLRDSYDSVGTVGVYVTGL